MSNDHGDNNKKTRGVRRFLLPLILFVFFAALEEFNTNFLHFFPDDFFSKKEIRLTSVPKMVGESYPVSKITDGDTIIVDYHGVQEKVRLLGINTPETVDPRKPVECFGKEASARMKSLATSQKVFLETDKTQGERDKYGRLLAYVYLEDGQMLNRKMISEGYAYEYTYLHPYHYQAEFKKAESFARTAKVGLWGDAACAHEALQH